MIHQQLNRPTTSKSVNSYLVLVCANQRLLVVVREEAVFQTEVSGLPAGEVLALLHQVPLPATQASPPEEKFSINFNQKQERNSKGPL